MVNVERINKAYSQAVSLCNYPKYKEASYFVVVVNKHTNEIIVLKRISFKRVVSKSLAIALPDDFEEETYDIYLMCDSYIGLDQVVNVNFASVNEAILAKKQGRKPTSKPVVQPRKKQQTETKNPTAEEEESYSLFGDPGADQDNEYESYDMMEQYAEKPDDVGSDSSFEFDVQLDDICDLTKF